MKIRSSALVRSALLIAALPLFYNFNFYAQTAEKPAQAAASPSYETKWKLQPIDGSIEEDKAVAEMLSSYSAKIKEVMKVVIGKSPEAIVRSGIAGGRLGMLISDITMQAATAAVGKKVDLAIQNAAGLRADMPAGEITVETIYRIMPFENEIAVIEMSGADLLAFCEQMARDTGKVDAPAVSGAEFRFRNSKLESVKIGDKPLDPQAVYTLGITDYLYMRGGDYVLLQRGKNYKPAGVPLREAIIDYIKAENSAGRPITAPSVNRIIVEK